MEQPGILKSLPSVSHSLNHPQEEKKKSESHEITEQKISKEIAYLEEEITQQYLEYNH